MIFEYLKYLNPDTLDIQRSPNQHGSFGFGIHYCVAARIARRTIDIAMTSLLYKFPNLQLSEDKPHWIQSLGYRGLTSLKVKI